MANSAGQGARGGRAPPVANSPLAYPRPGQAGGQRATSSCCIHLFPIIPLIL
jgi:hypothetical protein